MEQFKVNFIKLLLDSGALKIGNPEDPEGLFTLKSGRRSPFFMNLGSLNDGHALRELGNAYARTVFNYFSDRVDVLFGPAYKGIPLVVTTAVAMSDLLGGIRYCSNRKEIKDHGDAGILLGTKIKDGDRIVIVEDVTTSGKSIDETVPIIKAQANVKIEGLVVSFDRMEYGSDRSKTALEEVEDKYGLDTHAIVSIVDVLNYMNESGALTIELLKRFQDYYGEYGPEGRTII